MRKSVLPDEESWALPPAWREGVSPRRGGLRPADQDEPTDPDEPAGAVDRMRALLGTEQIIKQRERTIGRAVLYDRELLAAGHRHLDGWTGPGGPVADLTEAAVAAVLINSRHRARARVLADAWVSCFGIGFAVRAFARMLALVVDGSLWVIEPGPKESFERSWRANDMEATISMARRLRAVLAAASDSDHDEARDIVAGCRTSPVGRIVTSYLLPTEVTWVDADCEATAAGWPGAPDRGEPWQWADHGHIGGLLVLAASTVRHLELLRGNVTHSALVHQEKGEVGTWMDGVGPAAAPFLDDPFYRDLHFMQDDKWMHRDRMNPDTVRLLATVPTDDAMRLLLRRTVEGPRLRAGLLLRSGALNRFPVRALRILAELEAEGADPVYTDLLGGHVLADPRLLPAAAPLLPAPVLARAREIVASGGAGLGTAWTAVLDERYPERIDSADDEKRIIAALAALPTDEAFGLVLDRVDRKHFRPALLVAAKRDPRAALRVLAGRPAGEIVDELLRNHVLAYPEAVAETLPALSPEARARVEAITGPPVSPPAAAAPDHVVLPVLAGPLPRRAPGLPEWMVLPTLPAVTLRGTGEVLTPHEVRHLCALLAASGIGDGHPALAEVRAACDPAGLARFAWGIFEQWQAAGYPATSSLAMVALARLGDDTVVPGLTELFASWATASTRVRTGMDVLAAIGTDLALTHLHRLSRKARTAGFRALAARRLDDVAASRGLDAARLADRIVPDLGLDADGRTVLDFGPRRFTVGFDDRLQPWIADRQGGRLARLPRRAATDDPELARDAQRRYTELKKEVAAVGAERGRALEEAMAVQRRWSVPEFRRLLIGHPLTGQLTRRLLWAASGPGSDGTVFRVAEDHTLADLDDKTWEPGPDTTIAVAHPWHLGDERAAWAAIIADYAIIQPFPQVGRELFGLGDLDAGAVAGAPVESRRLHGLTARGWRFGDGHSSLVRDWPGGRTVEIAFSPGYVWDAPDLPQHLVEVRGDVGGLGPIGISEVVRDVRGLSQR